MRNCGKLLKKKNLFDIFDWNFFSWKYWEPKSSKNLKAGSRSYHFATYNSIYFDGDSKSEDV